MFLTEEYRIGKHHTSVGSIRVEGQVQFNSISWELTESVVPSDDLLESNGKVYSHPQQIGDFDKQQATDKTFMHFVIDASTVDQEGVAIEGLVDSLFVGFKKDDMREDEQLQINAQAEFDLERKRYVASIDFSDKMDYVNGYY
jgi:hypothetical protein